MDKLQWYEEVADIIYERLEEFYATFYPKSALKKIGNAYRLEPCPVCGHHNCCSVDFAVHCFSACDWRGTHINAWYSYATNILDITLYEAIQKLEEFSGVPFPVGSKEDFEVYKRQRKQQEILKAAESFYHHQLLHCAHGYDFNGELMSPLKYLTDIRKRKMETIQSLRIGFSANYPELRAQLLAAGHLEEEIKDAKIWVPEGLLVFFYKHPSTKDILRINTKNPFKVRYKETKGLEVIYGDVIEGYSTGSKVLLFSPSFTFKKPFVMVEGEHDLASVIENGCGNACCFGGNVADESLEILEKAESDIYTAFDHDETGEKYLDNVNRLYPDKVIKKLNFAETYNNESIKDIDEYYTKVPNADPIPKLMENAESIATEEFKIKHDSKVWVAENRYRKLEFIIKDKSEKGIIGQANLYAAKKLTDREDDVLLHKCKQKFRPMNFTIADAMTRHYNEIGDKALDELIDIYWLSSSKGQIISTIANKINEAQDMEAAVSEVKKKFGHTNNNVNTVMDAILKELNDMQNKSLTTRINIPKMRISQYFNVTNNDAYFYFNYVKQDGNDLKRLPYLMRNDGTMIRLDLMKRRDPQCVLLIDKKYELPFEVQNTVISLERCSLTQEWAERYANNEVKDEELSPFLLVKTIESYIRKFYHTTDENIYKILALYAYTTYYYELLDKMPYLYINGEKGSGKSVLDATLGLFCFNARIAVDTTEAALFRTIAVEGGTIILDEIENLTSRQKAADSSMASLLKGGYKRGSNIWRTNMEKGVQEEFEIYGPKIISNIFGLEDVTADRCIFINTYRFKMTKETRKEDPAFYIKEKLGEIRDVTSKCCLSAMKHFQKLFSIYLGNTFESGNARLSEILTPMLAVAKLADMPEREKYTGTGEFVGEYETSLINFFNTTISAAKKDIEDNTPEGIIKKFMPIVAKELLGIIPPHEQEYINTEHHKYKGKIKFNKEEGWFEMDVLHFKTFVEESMPGESTYTRIVPRWLKTLYQFKEEDIKRKTAVIEDEKLLHEMQGNSRPKVNTYRFYFRDFIDSDFLNKPISELRTTSQKNDTKTSIGDNLF